MGNVAGIDEVGRGALAGPVVAGACVLLTRKIPTIIRDSKKLTSNQRELAYKWLQKNAVFAVGRTNAKTIDKIGIRKANHQAMKSALRQLCKKIKISSILVDGKDNFEFSLPSKDVIKGDQKHACIAAASIVAKVTRDRFMIKIAIKYPNYYFEKNKGYGTFQHRQAIKKYGKQAIHRKTFVLKSSPPK